MFIALVILVMVICPALSVAIEAAVFPTRRACCLGGEVVRLRAVGIRRFSAGVRQVLQPAFTAREIFGIQTAGRSRSCRKWDSQSCHRDSWDLLLIVPDRFCLLPLLADCI